MSANEPMTQEELEAIQERLDAVEVDPPDEYWSYGAGLAWVPFCEHARDDIPALLAEVERLRALTTVDDAMVERVARKMADLEPGEDWPSNHDLGGGLCGTRDDEFRYAMHERAQDVIDAVLGPGEEA